MPQKAANSSLSGLIWAWYGLVRAGERPIGPIEAYSVWYEGESRSSESEPGASGCSGPSGPHALPPACMARVRVRVHSLRSAHSSGLAGLAIEPVSLFNFSDPQGRCPHLIFI
jgi:hypothetical protein